MEPRRTPEFERDIKRYLKKFRTLESDLAMLMKAVIELRHIHHIDNGAAKRIPGIGSDAIQIYKVKKFACRSLKGRGVQTGLRLIYAYIPLSGDVALLQLYYKPDAENEDRGRIRRIVEMLANE